ncbi:retrotransposon hot spot (RHS) protein, putative [Trypanosoma cruzi marinkellei]|uniref:Retrotransposon hot spot (RHS) protein, putative n=1 Tax=Trypanosoma cruzi marinkellei TaxID=85056 RepID=K2N812_TRYCR|nr:retrotransposon hot spot (RHS) protein, putative [Trypanosoma cruzi marinkellei]
MLAKSMVPNDFNLLISRIEVYIVSKNMEKCTVFALLDEDFMTAIRRKLEGAEATITTPATLLCAGGVFTGALHQARCFTVTGILSGKVGVNYWVLDTPEAENFPLVDAFFLLKSPRKTLVGLRMATASEHHTTASTVKQFNECLAAYFNGWEESSRDMSCEMIYLQRADSTPMNGCERCDVVNPNVLSDGESCEIAAFWKEKAREYQVSISSGDFSRDEAHRSVE